MKLSELNNTTIELKDGSKMKLVYEASEYCQAINDYTIEVVSVYIDSAFMGNASNLQDLNEIVNYYADIK